MKRWLMAVAVLLASAWTSAQADYVLIVYDLGVPKSKANQTAVGPGMGMMQGGPGAGMRDMMMQRMRGGMQGQGPPGRFGGEDGGGRGMQPGPGGMGGMPGRFGGGMNPFGGMRGFQGFFGNPTLEEDDDDESATLKVSAVVEVKKWRQPLQIVRRAGAGAGNLNPGLNPGMAARGGVGGMGGMGRGGFGGGLGAGGITAESFRRFDHKWGTTALYNAGDIQYREFSIPPREAAYKTRRELLLKDKTPENYRELAKWVLTNGMVEKFPDIMDELAKLDADDPAVIAYKKVKADIDRKITKEDTAAYYWQNKLPNYAVKTDGEKYPHYVLLYPTGTSDIKSDAPVVENRLKRLEENYRSFFYWFTLKGKVLTVPDQRLVAILVGKPEEYQEYHKGFDNVVTADDGFFARRENLVFFSATPQDEGYDALDKSMKDLWGNRWKRSELLKGDTRNVPADADAITIVKNQVKTLLLQALESESELEAVSHDGTLQLASVTGSIPRTVSAPEWVQFGIGSFFETPKQAWWQGTGAPSQLYLKKFKNWQKKKILDTPAETALKKVVTDEYFREARKINQDAAWTKARTMTWALMYYLAEVHLDELMAYFKELGNLPRDMEFDDEILMGCFVRAFKLADQNNPNQPRADALKRLAADWYSFMDNTQLENEQALTEAADALQSKREKAQPSRKKAPTKEKNKEDKENK